MRLEPLFDRYATAASLMTADNASAADMRAFISPLRYKNKMYLHYILITYKNFRNLLQLRCQIMT